MLKSVKPKPNSLPLLDLAESSSQNEDDSHHQPISMMRALVLPNVMPVSCILLPFYTSFSIACAMLV
jgi:hypothetical protein